MAEDFLPMLRAANIFPRNRKSDRPFGMVDVDTTGIGQMLRQVGGFTNGLKDKDMLRQQEMIRFQHGLNPRLQTPPIQAPMQAPKSRPNVVIGQGGFSPMQQGFREEERINKANELRSRESALARTESLNQALTLGKQRSEADMARTAAEINGRETVAKMNKELAAKAADEARTDKAADASIARKDKDSEAARARLEKGPLVNVADPNDPSKTISVRHNPATNKYERVKIDDDQAGTGYKQGTLPKPVANPAAQTGIDMAQQTIDEIMNNLLDKDDQLTNKAKSATGASHFIGKIPLPTDSRSGQASLKRVASLQLLALINHMKSQSRTGATGMGNMSNRDREALESASSKLSDPSLPEEEIRKEIVRVRDLLRKVANSSGPAKDDKGKPKGKRTPDDFLNEYGRD